MNPQDIKNYLTWPWLVSVPLLLCGFGFSVFFIGTDSILLAPAIVCLLCYAAIALFPNFRQGFAVPRSTTVIFIMLFWFWVFISNFWSTVPHISTTFTIILSILPLFFMTSVMAYRGEEWVKIHTTAFWMLMGGFALWAIIQFFVFYPKFGTRIHHPFLDPNSMAGLLNIGIFPVLGAFFLAKDKRLVGLSGLALWVFYMALLVTQSRGGLVSCAISAAVLIPFVLWRNPGGFPWKKLAFVAAIVVFSPLLGDIYNQGALQENLGGTKLVDARSMEDRFYLWESTLQMMKDHLWLGTGLASFYFYYPRYRHPMDRSDGFFAHMDPLQYGAEMGIIAPILFYAVLICILLRTIKALRLTKHEELDQRIRIMAPFCGMLALTGHAHINYHLYMPGMLLPLSLMLAYWYMTTEKVIGDAATRIIWKPEGNMRKAAMIALAVFLLVPGIWVARTSIATHMMALVQQESAAGRVAEAEKILYVAGFVAPPSYGRYPEYEARFRLAKLTGGMDMTVEAAKQLYDEAQAYLDEAEALNPAFTSVWDLRARLYYAMRNAPFVENGEQKAIDILTEINEKNPMAADSRIGLANIYKARGEIQKAAQLLEEGVEWPRPRGRTDVSYLVALAELKQQLGENGDYNLYMQEAIARARSYGMHVQMTPKTGAEGAAAVQ